MNQRKQFFLQVGAKRIPLINKITVIGRNPSATVHVDDQTVAKEHAYIQLNEAFDDP